MLLGFQYQPGTILPGNFECIHNVGKRRTLRFGSESSVDVGDKVALQDRDVGEVLNVAGNELLAVVPVDKADLELTIGGTALTKLALPYL